MKIRINGNQLRLRLTVDEWQRFKLKGKVEDAIQFDPVQKIIYTLRISQGVDQVQACYNHPFIMVLVPQAVAQCWIDGDEVGISASMELEGDKQLHIVVEKDFKCLSERAEDQNLNLFPHPERLNY